MNDSVKHQEEKFAKNIRTKNIYRKKYGVLIFSLTFFLLHVTKISPAEIPAGSQSFYWGRAGTAAHALGYSGISELSGLGGGAYNPAALANIKRIVSGLTLGGFGTPELMGDLQMAFPSDYGVFGFDVFLSRYSARYASGGVNPLGGFVFRWAKPLSRNMFWGADFNFHYINTEQKKDFALAINSGIVYQKFSGEKKSGFLDPSVGFTVRGIGKPALFEKVAVVNPPTIGVGMGASFVKTKQYRLRMVSDMNIGFLPMNFGWSVGLEQKFYDIVKLNVGYNLSTAKIGIPKTGPLHLGLGFLIKIPNKKNHNKHEYAPSDVDLEIFYTLSRNYYQGKTQWTHFLRLDIAWGYYDDKAPQGNVFAEYEYFSPNYDGIKDELVLNLQAHDNVRVNRWKVELYDEHKNLVREWKSLDPLEVKKLNFKKFFSQIARKKIEAQIPKKITWDGQNQKGRRVGDGKYFYQLKVWDDNDNLFANEPQQVILDTITPRFEAFVGYNIFSPNGDKAKDILEISFQARNYSADDSTDIVILNEDKKAVRSFHYKGIPPNIISWDGKTTQGKIADQGIYSIFIESKDKAENGEQQWIKNIRLVTDYETVAVKAKNNFLSPNNDGYFDNVEIDTDVSSSIGLESWEISISNNVNSKNTNLNNKNLKTKKYFVRTFKGYDSLPHKIVWDGKDDSGKVFPDGVYAAQAQLYYDSGNFPRSKVQTIEVDNTTPVIKIEKTKYLSFSPNGDGRQDEINFTYQINGQADDTVEMQIQDTQGNIFTKKIFSLKHLPSMFTWNGTDENNNLAKQGNYIYKVFSRDRAANFSQASVNNIFLKTGSEKVSLDTSFTVFSPNHDGFKDEIVFFPKLSSIENLKLVTLTIRDKNQKEIKTFSSKKFLEKITWNGTDDQNKLLADGDYFCQVQTHYDFGDAPLSKIITVRLDTQAPQISFAEKAYQNVFSPNADNSKDNLVIEQNVLAQADDFFVGKIMNSKGKIVKQYSWENAMPPKFLLWDGTDQNGKPVKEGTYSYVLKGEDSQKNKSEKTLKNIVLIRKLETTEISLSHFSKSFSNDPLKGFSALHNSLNIFSTVSSLQYLKSSELLFQNKQGNTVYKIFAKNALPKNIQWNGHEKNNPQNKLLPDDTYTIFSRYKYWHGNNIESAHKQFVLDSHAPEISLTAAPNLFTPDGDGENDTLFVSLVLKDFSPIKNWLVHVKEQDGTTVKTFSSHSPETVKKMENKIFIEWNGIDDKKSSTPIKSLQKYIVQVEATDEYNNKSSAEQTVNSGVLLESNQNGLHIFYIFSHLQNERFSAETKKAFDNIVRSLRGLASNPSRYGLKKNFTINIQASHIDNSKNAEENLLLSQKVTQQIYNYLLIKDLDQQSMTTKQSAVEKNIHSKYFQENKNGYVVDFFIER